MKSIRARLHLSHINLRPLGLALFGWMIATAGLTMAEDAVPLPKLPEGAGQMDEKVAKTFTTTE